MTQKLFLLESLVDNPLFRGPLRFDTKCQSCLGRERREDDLEPGFGSDEGSRLWAMPSLTDVWPVTEVLGRIPSYEDFPCIDLYPCFSQRAIQKLSDLLDGNGEILPVTATESEDHHFYCFHITRISDAFDRETSVVKPSGVISNFAFRDECFPLPAIFRLFECPMDVVVTDTFVERVVKTQLNGFRFTQIWPLAKEAIWNSPRDRKRIDQPDIDTDSLLRESLIVKAPDIQDEATRFNMERTAQAALEVASLEEPFLGALLGSEPPEEFPGDCVFEFSGPDRASLEATLAPWLSSFRGTVIVHSDSANPIPDEDDWPNLDRFL